MEEKTNFRQQPNRSATHGADRQSKAAHEVITGACNASLIVIGPKGATDSVIIEHQNRERRGANRKQRSKKSVERKDKSCKYNYNFRE